MEDPLDLHAHRVPIINAKQIGNGLEANFSDIPTAIIQYFIIKHVFCDTKRANFSEPSQMGGVPTYYVTITKSRNLKFDRN